MTRGNHVSEPRRITGKLRYRVIYVPHNIIEDHNATYKVSYEGKARHATTSTQSSAATQQRSSSQQTRRADYYF